MKKLGGMLVAGGLLLCSAAFAQAKPAVPAAEKSGAGETAQLLQEDAGAQHAVWRRAGALTHMLAGLPRGVPAQ
ncbi:hypothetical protein JQX13_52615 [Archangium violaceum]|uniref:hypothetical protein n=1 Tax=Archangium violaceum TaxID=83451 RepID=UPI00193C2DF8|nr:hypothetical protein [Archangium violaceum]QRK08462.1 hypothetical protein JQX13_52615 [Archangium violaceum]